MKKILLVLFISSCTKESIKQEATCGYVFDKYFQTSPAQPTTYWLKMAKTNQAPIPPATLPPGTFYDLQVSQSVFDTMLIAGQSYQPIYCY